MDDNYKYFLLVCLIITLFMMPLTLTKGCSVQAENNLSDEIPDRVVCYSGGKEIFNVLSNETWVSRSTRVILNHGHPTKEVDILNSVCIIKKDS